MLKKNAWLKRPPSIWLPGPASASGPHATNSEGEHEVEHHIGQRDDADETCPRDGQEQVVGRERRDPAEPFAHDVERAVAIEEPPPAVAADNGAEAEVAISRTRLSRSRRQRTRLKCGLGHARVPYLVGSRQSGDAAKLRGRKRASNDEFGRTGHTPTSRNGSAGLLDLIARIARRQMAA